MASTAASYDVFTPEPVAVYMKSFLPSRVSRMLEPSVGTGQLLSVFDGVYDHVDICDINPEYLCRIADAPNQTKHCGDFLSFQPSSLYDAIVMNPPYLRFQEMSDSLRKAVRDVSPILHTGNIDLYIAFLVKCISLLKSEGTLVAIVPSTWMYNKSCAKFRSYLMENRFISVIHDYGSEKVFKGVNVYCCILVLTKSAKDSYVVRTSEEERTILYSQPNVSSTLRCLKDVAAIQNGIATLCDEVFIHDTALFAEPCWKPIYKVSKQLIRSIIYPYNEAGSIVEEETFRTLNPQTYAYLLTQKERLAQRDRGHKTYEAWYAYGRKQAIGIPEYPTSVYMSTLCSPALETCVTTTMLFYSGIRLSSLLVPCEVLCESIREARDHLMQTCSKRGHGWLNVTTSALKQIPVKETE